MRKLTTGIGVCAVLAAAWALAAATPTVAVEVRKESCKEGAAGVNGLAAFVLRRSEASGAIDVSVAMSGIAKNGIDYVEVPSVIHMPAGGEPVTVVIQSLDDALFELSETVKLTVGPGAGYQTGIQSSATVTIEE